MQSPATNSLGVIVLFPMVLCIYNFVILYIRPLRVLYPIKGYYLFCQCYGIFKTFLRVVSLIVALAHIAQGTIIIVSVAINVAT